MADNYTQGTVAPFLPLRAHHRAVLAMIADCFEDLPDGVEQDGADVEVVDQALFDAWAEKYEETAGGALEQAKAGLLRILESGSVLMGDLAAVHYANDPDLVGPAGEKLYYLYSESGFGDWTVEFFSWVLEDMPEEIRFISFEYACTCSKMRPGEFGGGAWFIHRGGMEVINTGSWLHEMEGLLRRREEARSSPVGSEDAYVRNLLGRAAAFMSGEDLDEGERAVLAGELANAAGLAEDTGRCRHGMFFSGAGACPQCGGGAE